MLEIPGVHPRMDPRIPVERVRGDVALVVGVEAGVVGPRGDVIVVDVPIVEEEEERPPREIVQELLDPAVEGG